MSNAVQASNIKFQVGSQQRSSTQFRYAAELVRNGRIGQLQKVYVGLPGDPSGDEEPAMPVPAGFDYNKWLGSTPKCITRRREFIPRWDMTDRVGCVANSLAPA